jgi:hypothetical protein
MAQATDAGTDAASDGTRLAELLAVLSLASDLGLGAPLERGCARPWLRCGSPGSLA